MNILIEAKGLKRHYHRGSETVRALDGVDIVIRAGELVSILGPSGSGKTTLINLLSGLDAPSAGTLSIVGRPVNGLTEDELVNVRRGVLGFVFQQFHLLPTLTVAENVELPLTFLGRPVERSKTMALLAQVGLADRANHLPHELSGGQMQRTAIARSLIIEPKILVADEPTGNLDSTVGRAILDLFKRLAREKGIAILLTTHNQTFGYEADRILTLEDGKIIREEQGPVDPAKYKCDTAFHESGLPAHRVEPLPVDRPADRRPAAGGRTRPKIRGSAGRSAGRDRTVRTARMASRGNGRRGGRRDSNSAGSRGS